MAMTTEREESSESPGRGAGSCSGAVAGVSWGTAVEVKR